MGRYNAAVITAQGLEYIAQAISGQITLTFSRMVISDYAYPEGTDLSALTSIQSVKMSVEPASVWVSGDTVGVRGLFSNTTVQTAYNINTVGVFATNGTTEILFSVSTAISPDEMPIYNGVAPSSFIFTVQETINEASTINITVTVAGVATAQDIADLQAGKQDTITGAASSVASANLTGGMALVSTAGGKIGVSSVTSAADIGNIAGLTGNVQTQLNNKQATITGAASTIAGSNLTANRVLVSSASGKVAASTVLPSELGQLSGVTGNVQTQLDALKRHVVTTAGTDLNDYLTTGVYYFNVSVTPTNIPAGVNGILIVYSMQAAETATNTCKQFWLRQGTPGDNSYQMWERSIGTATGDSWSEWVRYLTTSDTLAPGAASSILNNDLTASRALVSNGNGKVAVSSTTLQELGYVHGVTSPIQTQLNGKQNTITGAASVITTENLDPGYVLVSSPTVGKVIVSGVTSAELSRLSGVTGNVQTQINNSAVTIDTNNATGINGTSIPNATSSTGDTAAGSFTLAAGKWMITVAADWDDADILKEGHRCVWLTNTQNGGFSTAAVMGSSAVSAISSGFRTRHQFTCYVQPTTSTTYYIMVRQYTTNGGSVKCYTRYSTIKLHG